MFEVRGLRFCGSRFTDGLGGTINREENKMSGTTAWDVEQRLNKKIEEMAKELGKQKDEIERLRAVLGAINGALEMGISAAEVMDENSPIRDALRESMLPPNNVAKGLRASRNFKGAMSMEATNETGKNPAGAESGLNAELAACPCGKIPQALLVHDAMQGDKWFNVSGTCCDEWMIEFRSNYHPIDSAECMTLAIEAWNEAPRAANV